MRVAAALGTLVDARAEPSDAAATGLQAAEPVRPIAIEQLGVATRELSHSTQGHTMLRRGLAALAAGRVRDARAVLDQLLVISPGLTTARYNAACAAARDGDVATAASLLERVLQEDLPEFLPRWHTDTDLESVRNSSFKPRIDALIAAVSAGWARAAEHGLVMLHWVQGSPSRSSAGSCTNPETLRPGVWLVNEDRWLPLLASVQHLTGVAFDQQQRRALLLRGCWLRSEGSVESVTDVRAEIHPLFDWNFTAISSPAVLTNADVSATLLAPNRAAVRWVDYGNCPPATTNGPNREALCARMAEFGQGATWAPHVGELGTGAVALRAFREEPDLRLESWVGVSNGASASTGQDGGVNVPAVSEQSVRFADGTSVRIPRVRSLGQGVTTDVHVVRAPTEGKWYALRSTSSLLYAELGTVSEIFLLDATTHQCTLVQQSPGTTALFRYPNGTVCYENGRTNACVFADGSQRTAPPSLRLHVHHGERVLNI